MYITSLTWPQIHFIKPLHDKEEIKLVTRSHIIIFLARVFGLAIVLIALFSIGAIAQNQEFFTTYKDIYWSLTWFITSIIIILFSLTYHNYFLSFQVMTNERIIDVDQAGLFKFSTNDTFLDRIEDLNFKQANFFQHIFNYGDVDAETAGQKTSVGGEGLVFENVPNPRDIVNMLTELTHLAENTPNGQTQSVHRQNHTNSRGDSSL
jgi:hypothetical protein